MRLIISLLCILSIYIYKSSISLDSDFGWHIRMGQIILEKGIPATDPLSYTMPSYPFVDHEWLTNVIIAIIHPYIGHFGLAVIFSMLAISAVLLQIPKKFIRWSILPTILIGGTLFTFMGVRTQIITWFLFSVALFLLIRAKKYRILFIPLMLIWTNLHGGFPIGLVILGVYIAASTLQHRRIPINNILLFLTAAAGTFINPYKERIWWEVWMQMSDHSLHWSILEWLPAFLFLNISLWMYVVVSTTLVFRYRKRFDFFPLMLYALLLVAGTSTYRHMPLWVIASVSLTLQAMEWFYHEVKKYKGGKRRLGIFYMILITLAVIMLIVEVVWFFSSDIINREDKKYPKKAIEYIQSNLPAGQIFTVYEWGGYMSWKLPQKRVFIDGRMPSFRWKAPTNQESDYVFKDYQTIMYGEKADFKPLRKKYNVEMVVLPNRKQPVKSKFDMWLTMQIKGLGNFFKKFIHIQQAKQPKKNAMKDLKEIYRDEATIIYKFK